MFIPPEVRTQIKQAANIVDVVSRYVPLNKMGNEYMGLCPFHEEDTPSFAVYPDTQSFYCFGCQAGRGEGNDVFSFLQKLENISFPEAAKMLADQYGITIPTMNSPEYSRLAQQYDVMRFKMEHYHEQLFQNHKAIDYLMSRGITLNDVKTWKIGYVPINGDDFDPLQGRVVFPIFDTNGRAVSFAGRAINGEKPKYRNGAESDIFKKKELLYGFHQAKFAAREENSIIVVEGYIDVIAMHRAGIRNVVGTMGTAFSTEHAQLLKKLLPNGTIYILFDGDASGKKAAMAADKELRKIQVRPLTYSLFHDQDPDDLVRQYGYGLYHLIKQEAKTIAQLRIEKILADYNHYTNWLRLYTTEQLVEILEELPEGDNKEWLEKESYLLMITDALRLNEKELRQRLLKQESTPQSVNTVEAS